MVAWPRIARPVLLLALGLGALALGVGIGRPKVDLRPERRARLADFPELSGLAYLPVERALLLVGDEGDVAVAGLDGRILRRRRHANFDFEDVVYDPEAGRAFAVTESERQWCEIGLSDLSLTILGAVPWQGSDENIGIEGVALAAGGGFWLAHESRPAGLVRFRSSNPELSDWVISDAATVSGVTALPESGELLLLSRDRGLRLLDASGNPLGSWKSLPGRSFEALAWVPGEGLFLGTDAAHSEILRLSASSESALREQLRAK